MTAIQKAKAAFANYAAMGAEQFPADPISRAQVWVTRCNYVNPTDPIHLLQFYVSHFALNRQPEHLAAAIKPFMLICTLERLDFGTLVRFFSVPERDPVKAADARLEAAWAELRAAQEEVRRLAEEAIRVKSEP